LKSAGLIFLVAPNPTMSLSFEIPSMAYRPETHKRALAFFGSLPENTYRMLSLWDALLTKTYGKMYDGLACDIFDDGGGVVVLLDYKTGDGINLRVRIVEANGSMPGAWKSFKKLLDSQLAITKECSLCYTDYGKHVPGVFRFSGCRTCGNGWCGACNEKMIETHNWRCPFCRHE
jgi:hypothetical protein